MYEYLTEKIENVFSRIFHVMDVCVWNIHNVAYSLMLVAITASVLSFFISLICSLIVKKRCTLPGLVAGSSLGLAVNHVMANLFNCVPRLGDIWDNVEVIMSYEDCWKPFLTALGLGEDNAGRIPYIMYSMSKKQWATTIEECESLEWYLERIQYSINNTIRFCGFHLGKPISQQGILVWFFLFLLLFIASLFLILKKKPTTLFVLLVVGFCCFSRFGTVVYMGTFLFFYFWYAYVLEFYGKRIAERKELKEAEAASQDNSKKKHLLTFYWKRKK